MMFLLISGVVALVFGLCLLFSPAFLGGIGAVFNRVVFFLDKKLAVMKKWIGLGLLVIGAWVLYVAVNYPEAVSLTPIWIMCLAFGLLFLFFANWLTWLSNLSNQMVLSTDEVVMGARKVIGIILIIFSIYIFYASYTLM